MATNQVNVSMNVGGEGYDLSNPSASYSTVTHIPATTIAVAKAGTLSVRGSNTAGTFTGTSHGFTTGQKDISIFWSGGKRRNVLVGTVSGNDVPFSGGTGDNLPVLTTAIVAKAATVETITLDASALVAWAANAKNFTERVIVSCGTTTTGTYTEGAAFTLNSGIWGDTAFFDSTYSLANAITAAGATMNTVKITHESTTMALVFKMSFAV